MLTRLSPTPTVDWRHPQTGLAARIAQHALDLLFPPSCVHCHQSGQLICPTCAQRVEPTPPHICERCGRVQTARVACCAQCVQAGPAPLRQVRAAGLHSSPLREFIHLLKYDDRPDLAQPLGRYLVAALQAEDWRTVVAHCDGVVPVPLHPERFRERGYNQAELLAHVLCQHTGLPLRTDLLQRPRATRHQVGLNAQARRENVAAAFQAHPACARLNLLLIDDVYTTGATLSACAQALYDQGAAEVSALTLAQPNQAPHHHALGAS